MCCCCICVQRMTTANQWLIVCKNQWKKVQWKKNSETPMDKGQKPNETQESRVEEKRNITTVVNNSSNIGEERKTAAVVVRTSDSVNDRGNEIVSPRLDPVQSTSCFVSSRLVSARPTGEVRPPHGLQNSPTVCGNSLRPAEISSEALTSGLLSVW